jgi:hypothetical protein
MPSSSLSRLAELEQRYDGPIPASARAAVDNPPSVSERIALLREGMAWFKAEARRVARERRAHPTYWNGLTENGNNLCVTWRTYRDQVRRLEAEQAAAVPRKVMMIYPGYIVSQIKRTLGLAVAASDIMIDQHQSNGLFGIHQARARIKGDPTVYRIIVAPADAPIFCGKVHADQHFTERLDDEARPVGEITTEIVGNLARELG